MELAKTAQAATSDGNLVAVIWSSPAEQADWNNGTPGHVEDVAASTLGSTDPRTQSSQHSGDTKIPTILLNQEYGPYKTYIGARARDLTDTGVEAKKAALRRRSRPGTPLLNQQLEQRGKAGESISDLFELDAKQAVARSVLTMMPAFHRTVAEAGIDE